MTWFSASLFSALIRVVFHLQINTKWTFSCRSGGERKVCVQNNWQFNVRSVFMKEPWQIKHTKITALSVKEEQLIQWSVKKKKCCNRDRSIYVCCSYSTPDSVLLHFFFFFQVREVALADLKASRAHPNKKRDVWCHCGFALLTLVAKLAPGRQKVIVITFDFLSQRSASLLADPGYC